MGKASFHIDNCSIKGGTMILGSKMQTSQLLSQIESGEGQYVEFKTSFAEENEAIKSLCAFTHADGGSVFFGVTNEGKRVGVKIGKNTIENFANKLRSCTEPPINPIIKQFNIEDKIIVVVRISKAKENSLHFAFNTAYIRIGKTNHVMSPNDIKERLYKGFQAENLAAKNLSSSLKMDPVKIKRIKQNIPDYLIRLTSGREILNIVTGCCAGSFHNDELTTQEEVDLVGGFFQSIQDWCDSGLDGEPSERVRIEFDLTQVVKELEEAGFFVFGGREIGRIEGGAGDPAPFPVSIIHVIRQTNPEIISIPSESKS